MKTRLKLKPFVLPSLYVLVFVAITTTVLLTSLNTKVPKEEEITYVSGGIINQDMPVINMETKIIYPYNAENVQIGKYFYDYQAEQSKQEQSIVYHENTYMQNSGIDFVLDTGFDVISILDGTVLSVKEDELLGKIIEIQHENDFISVYQSLSEVSVKKDDIVKQGQVIGKTGENELDATLKNHLHFELFHKGQVVNPENYFEKTLDEVQ